jgi:D-glycero-D-manno-heptose 1,7-bisphosphate phosphatase
MGGGKKVIFLDRDGTINVDSVFVHRIEKWEWCEGAIEALKKLQKDGFELVVVTNQSGIDHDLYTEEDMQKVHAFVISELQKHEVSFADMLYCRHRRDADCECRKPKTGMITGLEEKIGKIDFGNSWMVGDKVADMGFGKNVGAKTALIKSKYWQEDELENKPDIIVGSLLEATKDILSK